MAAPLLLWSIFIAASDVAPPPLVSSAAADSDVGLARTMKTRMVSLSHGLLRGSVLLQGENEIEVGMLDSRWLQAFADNPVALGTAERARSLQLASVWLFASGSGLAGVGTGMVAWALSTGGGMLVAGLAVVALALLIEVSGSLVFRQAQALLLDAVRQYNAGLINQGLPEGEQVPLERGSLQAGLPVPGLLTFHF
jgi:hypothetical protein